MVSQKNIVITGCQQGIGKETLRVFAEHGADVFACAYEKHPDFESYCEALSAEHHVRIRPVYFDLMDNGAVRDAARQIQSEKTEIHGLLHIAGMTKDALFHMMTYQDLLDIFQVNFFSQMILTQYIGKIMQRKHTCGSIVFTSSLTALTGNTGQTAYGASKAAITGAMRSLSAELAKDGIRVNAVAPGVIKSPMTEALSQELIRQRLLQMDLPRLGEPQDVANMYLFLMSDMSKHITGQVLRIDGGM